MKYGKKYSDSIKLIDRTKLYDPEEAIELVKQTAKAKFDETVEISVRLGVDPVDNGLLYLVFSRSVVELLLHVGSRAVLVLLHIPTDMPSVFCRVCTFYQFDPCRAFNSSHTLKCCVRLSEDVLCSTFAEGFCLDGGFKREPIWHFTHLLEDILHFLRVGEELLLLTVHLDGNDTAVFALTGLHSSLEVFYYDGQVHQLADAYHRTRKSLLAVFWLVSDIQILK